MDWAWAIERNREALRAILAALSMMLGGAVAERIPRALHRAAIRVLGPAESAVRRLIVMAARGLEAGPVRSRARTGAPPAAMRRGRLAFRLFDRRKRFAPSGPGRGPRLEPRIHVFGGDPRVGLFRPAPPPEPAPARPIDDGLMDVRRLRLRLAAAVQALADLPRQARRLVRWQARRALAAGFRFRSPLRPGPPPGHRKRKILDVDFVLADCHGLAHDALAPNTS